MSNISNRHSVIPFVAGESKALTGQRLAKVGYKSTAKNKAKFPSIAVSVPQFTLEDVESNFKRLLPYIGTMLENAQDGVIRSLYESSDGTLQSVGDDDISVNAIIGFLEAEANGGRLTKEFLNQWFAANVADNLSVVIAEKLGFNDPTENQMAVVVSKCSVYRDLIASLSGGATILTPEQRKGIRRALEVSTVDDDTSKKLIARLDKMDTPIVVAEMLEL